MGCRAGFALAPSSRCWTSETGNKISGAWLFLEACSRIRSKPMTYQDPDPRRRYDELRRTMNSGDGWIIALRLAAAVLFVGLLVAVSYKSGNDRPVTCAAPTTNAPGMTKTPTTPPPPRPQQ